MTLMLLLLGFAAVVHAEPIAVRGPESSMHAFPVLTTATGQPLAAGEFVQTARDAQTENRLVLRFHDGSLHDEQAVFTRHGVLRLSRYRLVQRGPSFPRNLEATVDRERERFEVRHRARDDAPWELLTGRLALPADVYNGMLPTLLEQISPAAHTFQIVAFTPQPRVVTVRMTPAGEEQLVAGDRLRTMTRYRLTADLGPFASLFVADIPPAMAWVANGDVPRFARFQGPLYFTGPIWRIEDR